MHFFEKVTFKDVRLAKRTRHACEQVMFKGERKWCHVAAHNVIGKSFVDVLAVVEYESQLLVWISQSRWSRQDSITIPEWSALDGLTLLAGSIKHFKGAGKDSTD